MKFIGCLNIFIAFLGVVALIIMISMGTTVVAEYNLAKTYTGTWCTFDHVEDVGRQGCEYCYTTSTSTRRGGKKTTVSKRKCKPSTFRCVRVVAFYDDVRGRNQTGVIHTDALQRDKDKACSFTVPTCHKLPQANDVEVENFVFRVKSWRPFSCYYNDNDAPDIIMKKLFTFPMALHSMLWPGLIFVVCILIIVYRCCVSSRGDKKAADSQKEGGDSTRHDLDEASLLNTPSVHPGFISPPNASLYYFPQGPTQGPQVLYPSAPPEGEKGSSLPTEPAVPWSGYTPPYPAADNTPTYPPPVPGEPYQGPQPLYPSYPPPLEGDQGRPPVIVPAFPYTESTPLYPPGGNSSRYLPPGPGGVPETAPPPTYDSLRK